MNYLLWQVCRTSLNIFTASETLWVTRWISTAQYVAAAWNLRRLWEMKEMKVSSLPHWWPDCTGIHHPLFFMCSESDDTDRKIMIITLITTYFFLPVWRCKQTFLPHLTRPQLISADYKTSETKYARGYETTLLLYSSGKSFSSLFEVKQPPAAPVKGLRSGQSPTLSTTTPLGAPRTSEHPSQLST